MVEKTKTPILIISGTAQHGKDTFAAFAKDYIKEISPETRVLILSFASPLKNDIAPLFGYNGNKMDPAQRKCLQDVAKKCRENRPECFCTIAKETILATDGCWDIIIIPDWRYPNEVEEMESISDNVMKIRVIRPGYDVLGDNAKHESETALADYNKYNFVAINDSTLDDYKDLVHNFVNVMINDWMISK